MTQQRLTCVLDGHETAGAKARIRSPGFAGSPASHVRLLVQVAIISQRERPAAFTCPGLRWTHQQAMAYGGVTFIVQTVVCLSCDEAVRPRGCAGGAGP